MMRSRSGVQAPGAAFSVWTIYAGRDLMLLRLSAVLAQGLLVVFLVAVWVVVVSVVLYALGVTGD